MEKKGLSLTFDHDAETAEALAERALELMRRYDVTASPRNFAVWYAYAAEVDPNLNHLIDLLIHQGYALNEPRSQNIYTQFFEINRQAEAISDISERIEYSMAAVAHIFGKLADDAEDGQDRFKWFEGLVENVSEAKSLHGLAENILRETKSMSALTSDFKKQLERNSAEIAALREQLASVRQESLTDSLTGLSNRKAFDKRITELCQSVEKNGSSLSLIMADIDHFKMFNDHYGHQAGDIILRIIGRSLSVKVREDDVAARYGGEEFALLLPKCPLKEAELKAEEIRTFVSERYFANRRTGQDYGSVTLSLGVAEYTPGESVESFIRRADMALYEAKQRGRNVTVAA